MPRANWGIEASDVDEFDRDSQYKPYLGLVPPDGVYVFLLKKLQFVAGTNQKNPQLRTGLELVPREGAKEDEFDGYFIMDFLPISQKTQFRYVPLLDALGVTGREFIDRTVTDEEGNIKKIGKWRNTGEEYLFALLKTGTDQNGEPRKEVGWYGEYTEDYDEDDVDDEEEYYDEEDPV